MTHEYQRVPSSAAERVATEFHKDVCVITCYDRTHQKTHTTCWGRTPNDKAAAMALGKILASAAGANVERSTTQRHSDDIDKGELVLWVQFLQSAAAKALLELTGVQTFPPGDVARELMAALNVSEFADNKLLDAAGLAMMQRMKKSATDG
jgi:hypothetical protein